MTHFKSLVNHVQSREDISDDVGYALSNQYMFDRRTSPWELAEWDKDELQNFNIQVEKIDRLYSIKHEDDGISDRSYYLLARMEYKKDDFVFVELAASCDFTGFDCRGGGNIFVTKHVSLFTKVINLPPDVMTSIYQSLRDDGLSFEEQTEYDRTPSRLWHNPPMLKYLCHKIIYEEKEDLKHYGQVLPKILKESVDDFIKTRDAIESYDNWVSDYSDSESDSEIE